LARAFEFGRWLSILPPEQAVVWALTALSR
jgi:hypothetical protein